MKIIRLSQDKDREAWLQLRLGKITGTKAKKIKPLTRGVDRVPQGFWQILAEQLAVQSDGEEDLDRGHRLENESLQIAADKLGLSMDLDPGMWISDDYEDIAV